MSLLVLLFSLLSACVYSDYVQLGSNQYPINSNSCPIGQLCDYTQSQANSTLNIISSCNTTLIELFKNFNSSNQTENDNICNVTIECVHNLTNVYATLLNIYYTKPSNIVSNAHSSVPSKLIYIVTMLAAIGLFKPSKQSTLVTIMLIFLILSPNFVSAEGDGGGEGHASEGDSEGDSSSSDDAQYGPHASDDDAYVTNDGHVESNGVYYWQNIAVSSISRTYNRYVIGYKNPNYVTITNNCTIVNVSSYVQEQTLAGNALLEKFLQFLNSTYNSSKKIAYNLSDVQNLFSTIAEEATSLKTMCVSGSKISAETTIVAMTIVAVMTIISLT